jgi:hypothetical protein
MGNIVKVISSAYQNAKLFVKFLRYGNDDVQNNHQFASFGIDSNPIKDLVAIYIETGVKGESAIIGYINPSQIAAVGETRIYSTNADGVVQMFIHLKNDGTAELNGTGNFLVKFNELQTAFNELKTAFNTHTHVGNLGAPTATALPQSAADIAAAKHTDFKTN